MSRRKNLQRFVVIMLLLSVYYCNKDSGDLGTDTELYSEIRNGKFTYYNNGNVLTGSSSSPHGSFKLRFNQAAASLLDTLGELPIGYDFPPGSLLIHEHFNGEILVSLSVMKKDPSHINAVNGWLWCEFDGNGSASYSTGKKGESCINCHSSIPNRDFVKTFDLH